MRQAVAAALIALAGVTGMPAEAATVYVHLDGYLESQVLPGTDPNLSVGDKFTLTATYDTGDLYYLGPNVPFWLAAPKKFDIRTEGLDHWTKSDEENDGSTVFTYGEDYYDPDGSYHGLYASYGAPLLAIQGQKVVGVSGFSFQPAAKPFPRSMLAPGLAASSPRSTVPLVSRS